MTQLRALAISILFPSLASAAFAAEPVASLPSGFRGEFAFRVSGDTVLQAKLTLPERQGPFPLVVVLHGGGGSGGGELESNDVADLVPRGYAVAVVDSFSGRGFKPESGTGAGASLRPTVRVPDPYAALQVLVTHPQIDKERALLFGRSHGGATTMIAATSWAKSKYSPAGPAFKGFVALYPVCSVTYPEFDLLTGPLRLHLGAKDELTQAKPCEAIVAQMRSRNQDAAATTYEDAHHVFDAPWPVSYFGQWLNYGSCAIQLPSVDAPLPGDQVRQCVKRGASMGGNSTATKLFRQNMATEITIMLR